MTTQQTVMSTTDRPMSTKASSALPTECSTKPHSSSIRISICANRCSRSAGRQAGSTRAGTQHTRLSSGRNRDSERPTVDSADVRDLQQDDAGEERRDAHSHWHAQLHREEDQHRLHEATENTKTTVSARRTKVEALRDYRQEELVSHVKELKEPHSLRVRCRRNQAV
jgi:hypothetical protein